MIKAVGQVTIWGPSVSLLVLVLIQTGIYKAVINAVFTLLKLIVSYFLNLNWSEGQRLNRVEVLTITSLTLQLALVGCFLAVVGPTQAFVCRRRGPDRSTGAGWTRLFLKTPTTVTRMDPHLSGSATSRRRCGKVSRTIEKIRYVEDSSCSLLQLSVVLRVEGQLHPVTSDVQMHDGIGQDDAEDGFCPRA